MRFFCKPTSIINHELFSNFNCDSLVEGTLELRLDVVLEANFYCQPLFHEQK